MRARLPRGESTYTTMHLAIHRESAECVRFLQDRGASGSTDVPPDDNYITNDEYYDSSC